MLKKHGGGNNNKSRRLSSDDESGGGPSREMFKQSSQASPLFRKSASIDPPDSLSDNERPRPPSQQSARGEGKKKMLSSFLSNLFGNKTPEDELNNGSNIDGKKSTSRESVNSVLSSSSFSYVNPKKMGGKQMKGKRIPVDDPNYGKIGDGRRTLGATLDRIGMKMGLKKKYNLQSCESLQYIDACDDAPPLPLLEVLTGSSPPKSTPAKSTNTQGMLASDERLGQSEIVPTTVTELSAECQAITNHFSPKSEPSDKASVDCKVVKKVTKTTAVATQNVPPKNEALLKLPSSKSEDTPPKIVASADSTASTSQDLPKQVEAKPSLVPTLQEPPHKIETKLTSLTQVVSQNSVTQTTPSTENASPKILLKTAFLSGVAPQKTPATTSVTTEVAPQKIAATTSSTAAVAPQKIAATTSVTTEVAPQKIAITTSSTTAVAPQKIAATTSTTEVAPQKVATTTSTTKEISEKTEMKTTISTEDASKKLAAKSSSSVQYDSQKIATSSNADTSTKITTTSSNVETPTKLTPLTISTLSQDVVTIKSVIVADSSPTSQKPLQTIITKNIPQGSSQNVQQKSIVPVAVVPSYSQDASQKLTNPVVAASLQDVPKKENPNFPLSQTASQSETQSTEIPKLRIQEKILKVDSASPTTVVPVLTKPETVEILKTDTVPIIAAQEPVASTSRACFPGLPHSESPTSSTAVTAGSSNTWSSSTKRKRRAPAPPMGKVTPKFVNGVSSNSNSIVTDIPNDVPSSSSQAAALTKFKRINESPVRSVGTFEIRPRKKERSVEPVTRPLSYIMGQNSNTLSSHSLRYHHKRSSSDSNNTNTRGRIHKPGKKKAPPPPNPFGDPDAEEETEDFSVSAAATNDNVNETGTRATTSTSTTTTGNTSSASSSVFSSPQVVKKSSEKPPLPKVASTPQTQEPIASTLSVSSSAHTNNVVTVTTTNTTVSSSQNTEPEPVNVEVVTVTANDSVECSSDELEEIRQNMLNDQQERQLLASEPTSSHSTTTTNENYADTQVNNNTPNTSPEQSSSSSNQVLSRNDIQAAQNTLQVLTASINTTKPKEAKTPEAAKAKLIELKKEAEKSPLNAVPKKSRPASIGSSIYESPLALLLGKSSKDTSGTGGESSAENSPRATPKPWYKRSASSAFAKQLVSPKSKSSNVKPFTALVKFSELDKEAGKIVEENRRKSAEQRFNENAQELLALFSSTFPEPVPATTTTHNNNPGESPATTSTSTQSHAVSASAKVSTIAQVHAISEETELASEDNSTAAGGTATATNQNSSSSAAGSAPPTNSGSSSPPAFQSVHEASKHRQIKPLLTTSPSIAVRSEKLAIVQPQSSNSTGNESNERTPWRVTRTTTSAQISSSPSVVVTTTASTTTTVTSSQSTGNLSSTSVTLVSSPSTTTPAAAQSIISTSSFTRILPSTKTTTITSTISTGTTTNSATSATTSTTTTTTSSTTPSQAKPNTTEQWDCPRCTLKNPSWRILCEICFYRKEPITSNSYMSSILQRVNAESTKVSTSTVTSPGTTTTTTTPAANTCISAARQRNSVTDTSSVITTVPPSSTASSLASNVIPPGQSLTTTSTSTSSFQNKNTRQIIETKQSDILSCENFLSQLPVKQDVTKEEILYGMRLHEDPELEELDIGKLREARLAYFQKQNSTTSTTSYHSAASSADESVESPTKTNDLGAHHHHEPSTNLVSRDDTYSQSQQASRTRASSSCEADEKDIQLQPQQKFKDNDDDFIDYILQLDNHGSSPTNVSNITGPDSCSRSLKPTSSTSCPSSGVPPTATQPLSSSPNLFLRYRPRLEMIREGNSGDYTYCYSSTEIAQIYENWQANENGNGIGNKTSSSSSQALHPFPQQTHLFEYQQPQQTSTAVHQHPVVFGNNVYPTGAPFHANNTTQGNFVPILPVDHQPYANNRLSHSPEDNYVNTMAGMAPTATTTPTLNETANFSCATSPLRFSPFPPVLGNNNVNDTSSSINIHNNNNMSRSSGDRQINQRFGESSNYENNGMSLTPGGSRRLTYEDYRRMGAIPKGYSFSSRNDDWSSESSCDTDTSSRGYWTRAGYQDSLHGMTRRGNLDIPHDQSNGFPEPSAAHGKLMKRLEAAIANGDHRLAATLAHDLALMKVNCVVAKINQPFSIRVYVEDRFMQQGPFLMQVSSMMTVHELKAKIESDWGIPTGFQKWILGRKMAEDDNLSLSSYEMAQDSMAFLFLVTPDIGNVRPNVVVPIDNNKASNNVPSISEASTSAVIKNINKSDRNSMSPTLRNIMPSYANLNDNNSGHVYNNFSMDNINAVQQPTVATKQSPRVLRKSQDSPTSIASESKVNSSSVKLNNQPTNAAVVVASPKKSSSAQTSTAPNVASSVKKETSPPPLPSRSPIPHAPVKSSEKGNRTPIKAHSKTPERTNSNPSSLKSNQKNVKQQNSNSKTQAQQHQQTSLNSETLSAASALTASLQQKLAEFKNLAELTFSKAGSPGPSRSIKEPSPVSSKIINKSDAEKKVDPKEGKPPRKPGKVVQPASSSSSSKEKRLTSASNSTEKLAKEGLKNEDPVKENRFNGVLLPTPKENENVKPPERSDKTKGSSVVQEATAKQRLPKADKVIIYENRPKDTKNPDPESTTVQLKPVEFKEKSPETLKQPSSTNLIAVKVEEGTKKAVELPDVTSNPQSPTPEDNVAPKPMPRGLKKQQSVERELQPSSDKLISAPKPAPRTVSNKGIATGATCESQDPQPEEYNNIPITASVSAAPSNTTDTPQQQPVVEGGCQTTLPFPVAKHRFNATTSSVKAEPTSLLLRPSAFVTQQARPENDRSSNSPSNTSSSSVLLPFITANSSSPTVTAPIQATTTVNTWTVSSSSTTTTTPPNNNIAHVQPFNTTKQVSTPTAHVAPFPSSSNSIPTPEAPSQEKSKEDNVNSYLKMLELMEKQDLIFTSEDTECPVCFTPVPAGDGVILRDCLHVFCKECLVGCVQYADDTTVKCPYRDADYSCSNNLLEREIKALVPTEVFEKYLARSLKLAESKIVNTFHCKTPDCTGWCVFEDDVNVFVCPVCKKRNCLTCAAIHEGIDCLRFQRELAIAAETDEDAKQSRLMLEKMIQRGEALECPACHVVLLKKWGCDWVRCTFCKTELCWITKGLRWGKGGKGDISGGCKCGVNGVKCHPKCTYCH